MGRLKGIANWAWIVVRTFAIVILGYFILYLVVIPTVGAITQFVSLSLFWIRDNLSWGSDANPFHADYVKFYATLIGTLRSIF